MRAPIICALLLALPIFAPALAAPSGRVPISLSDRAYVGAFLRVPANDVQPFVPSPLRVVREFAAMAIVQLGALSCQSAATDVETGPADLAWLGVNVITPTEPWLRGSARMETNGLYYYAFETFTGADALGRAAARVGFATQGALIDAHSAALGSSLSVQSAPLAYSAQAAPSPGLAATGAPSYAWRVVARDASGFSALEGMFDRNAATAGTVVGVASFSEGSLGATLVGPSFAGLASFGPEYRLADGFIEHR